MTESVATEEELEELVPETLKLPNMNEFAPGTLGFNSVRVLLDMLKAHEGDGEKMVDVIKNKIRRIKATKDDVQRIGRAKNVLIGMRECGLLERDQDQKFDFTKLAQSILEAATPQDAADIFTIHILERLHGITLIDIVELLRARGEAVGLSSVRTQLRAQGFEVTENENNASKLRMWMEASGVIDNDWNIDEAILHRLLGATSTTLSEWSDLSRAQRIFLVQLREVSEHDPTQWVMVRGIKARAESQYGRTVFPEGHLRRKVVERLQLDGWLETQGTGRGRGGDSGEVRPCPKLLDLSTSLPLETKTTIPADLRPHLAKRLDDIFKDLKDKNTDVKGRALELLALNILRDIGLLPVGFRQRGAGTRGAEVDLLANGVHLHYSRWIVQCKNKALSTVEVREIAEEVGMAVVMNAHVIAMITTGKLSRAARLYANGVAATSNLQVICIDKEVLKIYGKRGGNGLIEWLRANALHTLALKEGQVAD